MQEGRKSLPAKQKKWNLTLKRELLPDWKVQVIVRKSGAKAGGHVLKFRAGNGKTFSSWRKAFAYDCVVRAARGVPRRV